MGAGGTSSAPTSTKRCVPGDHPAHWGATAPPMDWPCQQHGWEALALLWDSRKAERMLLTLGSRASPSCHAPASPHCCSTHCSCCTTALLCLQQP